jgi:hypothetical protein
MNDNVGWGGPLPADWLDSHLRLHRGLKSAMQSCCTSNAACVVSMQHAPMR